MTCSGCNGMSELLLDFAAAVTRHPDRTAIVDGTGRAVTFADLQARSFGFAHAWQRAGVGKGDRVLLAMPLNADLYAALAALWTLGATVVLPEPAMGLAGLRHAARVTRPRAFCSAGLYGALKWALPELWRCLALRPAAAQHAGPDLPLPPGPDIALISFTSGTSGQPKAIPRSHEFLSAQHRAIAPLLSSPQAERDLVAFPVFVLINLGSGQTSVLPNWKMSRLAALDPRMLQGLIQDQGVTRALLPPLLCEKFALGAPSPALHTVFTGGGPVFPALLDRMMTAQPGLRITCVYGSTEAEPIAHLDAAAIAPEDRAAMDRGQGLLVGHPVPSLRLRIVEDEIQVAGAHVNAGYLDPQHDAGQKIREGDTIWHRTGDAGHLDTTGRLWLMGRTGSAVRVSGRNTYPFAVEVAARDWPGVTHCALMAEGGSACLVVQGDRQFEPVWQARAAAIGISRIVPVRTMPMDRRHGSKIDRTSLRRTLRLSASD